jgi:hypothetical protein
MRDCITFHIHHDNTQYTNGIIYKLKQVCCKWPNQTFAGFIVYGNTVKIWTKKKIGHKTTFSSGKRDKVVWSLVSINKIYNFLEVSVHFYANF